MNAASKAGAERESAKNSAHHHEPEHKSDSKHPRAQSFLALTALGVVFGDIGTSPLYTFSTALNAAGAAPGATQVLGVVSLTFWALMVLISLKYVTVVLRADNDGEGCILALLSLVEHHGQMAERVKLSIVVALGVIGAALLYGDGVITPAISVLSAIEGLKFSPAAANFVVPATLVILVGLFALQYRGTGSVGRLFGPVMVIWFVAIGVLGAINIWSAPQILTALNPLAAVRFAIESPLTLFIVLGGVFLALTGGEALYADMGHVGSRAIPPGVVRSGVPGIDPELLRAGRPRPDRSEGDRKSILQSGPGLGAGPDGGAGDSGHDYRLAGAYLRRVLDDAPGHSDGTVAALENRTDVER